MDRKLVQRLVGWVLAIGGLSLISYAYFGIREPLPFQVQAVAPGGGFETQNPTGTVPSTMPSMPAVIYQKSPHLGSRLGTITFPTLNLSWPIYEGTTTTQLAKGVGHFVQSVMPGQNDNTVLSGHRTTVFNRLGQLKRGQDILVQTSAGTFKYAIRSLRIVLRTDRSVIVHTNQAVLTLTTCYPFNNIGTTTKAFIVTAFLTK